MSRLLDLFCGAGGASVGYHRAGFDEIVGIDIKPMPRYPFEFVQADALEYVAEHGHEFDAIHASPPCQGYSYMTNNLPWHRDRDYPYLIYPVKQLLEAAGVPWVIENVMGARYGSSVVRNRGLESHGLEAGYLCGQMFGLPFYRHRLFATNWFWLSPGHPEHRLHLHPRSERYVYGGDIKGLPGGAAGLDVKPTDPFHDTNGKSLVGPGNLMKEAGLTGVHDGVMGHNSGWKLAAEAMGIDWMKREELTQAIPPAYCEFIGKELLKVMNQ